MVRVSPHLVGSHEMGRCSHGGGGVWSAIFKMVRASPHFSSSHGIPRDGEMFSWRGWGMVFLSLWASGSCLGAPPPPRRTSPHLVGSHEMRRNGEKLSPFLKSHEMERSSPGGVGVWSNPTRRKKSREISRQYMPMLPLHALTLIPYPLTLSLVPYPQVLLLPRKFR